MGIHALSRQEFDRFSSTQLTLAAFTTAAVEWFADDTGLVLGAVTHREADRHWSFVVLVRDSHGQFGPLTLQFGAWNAGEARRLLLARMNAALTTVEQESLPPSVA
jgi:hypothetical protein